MTQKTSGQVIGYARVSTTSQNLDGQTDALKELGADHIYSDKLSGLRSDRPGFRAMLDYVREGDMIVVASIDRLGRDAAEVIRTVKDLNAKGITLRSLREGIDSTTPMGRGIVGIMASLAEMEIEMQRERGAASREARRARGMHVGRPRTLSSDKTALVKRMRDSGEPIVVIANTFGVSRATVYRTLSA